MLRKSLVALIGLSLLFLLPINSESAPPIPARIGGTVTIDGVQLTQATDDGYTFKVTQQDGSTPYDPVAEDTDGLNASDFYIIDLPIYDSTEQAGGANPGDTAMIHLYKDGSELLLINPLNGEFVVGGSGSTTQIDIETGQPPTADAGPDQTVFDSVTLDGNASSDSDGPIVSWAWTLNHRTNPLYNKTATGPNPKLTNLEAGFYDVELTVADNSGDTDTDVMLLGVAGSWDINGDGKIGLAEAIHALQVVSGLK